MVWPLATAVLTVAVRIMVILSPGSSRSARMLSWLVGMLLLSALVLVGCGEAGTPPVEAKPDEQVELGGPIVNSVNMVLVPIPAGEFMMGSPESEAGRRDNETQHRVQITKPYYLSAYEVTQAQYEKVMGNNPRDSKGDAKPVEMVFWNDAVMFCQKLRLVTHLANTGHQST